MSSPLAPLRTAEQHAPSHSHNGSARRSFTVPARLRSQSSAASTSNADGIETLVVCPHSRIVSFTATGALAAGNEAQVAWKTPTERTLAVGMRCYATPTVCGVDVTLQVSCASTA